MAGNLPRFGFKATENDHCLPARLSFNLLDGQLYGGRKVVNGAVEYDVSVGVQSVGRARTVGCGYSQ